VLSDTKYCSIGVSHCEGAISHLHMNEGDKITLFSENSSEIILEGMIRLGSVVGSSRYFKLLAPELFFLNFSTPCIQNVNNTGTK